MPAARPAGTAAVRTDPTPRIRGRVRSARRRSRGTSGRDCMSNYTGPDPNRIRSMFASISTRYDRANTVLSGGIHHLWRRKAVRWSQAKAGDRVLDCATGTGDLAIAFYKAVAPGGRVVGTDFVPEMLDVARTKAPGITF